MTLEIRKVKVNLSHQNSAGTSDDWVVYILRCADGSFYTGITRDMQRRLHEHNHCNRLSARYTRARRPVQLVFQAVAATRSAATLREAAIKRLSRAEKQALITPYKNADV